MKGKAIPGYEGLYQISKSGRVISINRKKRKLIKPVIHPTGYAQVTLWKDGRMKTHHIHRLMARTYLGGEPEFPMVMDHINEKKWDNRVENLRIISHGTNVARSRCGVYLDGKRWRAKLGKWTALFDTEEEATNERDSRLNERIRRETNK